MLRHGLIAIHEWHTLSENQVHAMVEWQGALPEKQAIRYRLGGSVLPVFDFRFWGCDPERGVCFLFKVPLTSFSLEASSVLELFHWLLRAFLPARRTRDLPQQVLGF